MDLGHLRDQLVGVERWCRGHGDGLSVGPLEIECQAGALTLPRAGGDTVIRGVRCAPGWASDRHLGDLRLASAVDRADPLRVMGRGIEEAKCVASKALCEVSDVRGMVS